MVLVGVWSSLVFASPAHEGAVHIGATPVEKGTSWAGVGVGASTVPFVAGGAEAGMALGSRGAVHVVFGLGSDTYGSSGWLAAASARVNAIDRPTVRLALTGQLVVFEEWGSRWGVEARLVPGLALDVGGPSVRFDVALPLFGLTKVGPHVGPQYFPLPIAGTLGVSANLDRAGHHRLRLGLPEGLSYQLRADRYYLDVGITFPMVWAKVGLRFGT